MADESDSTHNPGAGGVDIGDVAGDISQTIIAGRDVRDVDIHFHQLEEAYDVRGLSNPYLGLRAFTYDERNRYAGRERTVEKAVKLLTTSGEQRILLFITGASGSGKSSFVQAGLFPALETYYQQRNQTVRRAVFRPSRQPLAGLADGLLQLGLSADGPFTMSSLFMFGVPAEPAQFNQISLLVIDQFEELFTQSEPSQRDALFAILTALPSFADLRMHIIMTLRVDYLPDLFTHQTLYNLAKQGIDLRAMSVDELKDAIQRPLQDAYATEAKRFEEALLEKLVHDAAGEATYLPLLQVTLEDLWRRGSLTRGAYGELTDAIQKRAEDVYAKTRNENAQIVERTQIDQETILQIFLDLVEVSLDDDNRRDVRRHRTLLALARKDAKCRQLIEELIEHRLLSKNMASLSGSDENTYVVDIIHESLISNWTRLRNAIKEQRDILQQRTRFEQALKEWLSKNQDDAYLLNGKRLAEAEDLNRANDVSLQSDRAQQLLKRSVNHRETRRRRLFRLTLGAVCVLGLLLIISIFSTVTAVREQHNAETAATAEAKQAHEARYSLSAQLAANAQTVLKEFPERSLLLAIEALNVTDRAGDQPAPVAINVLWQELANLGGVGLYSRFGSIFSIAISPNNRWLVVGSLGGTQMWDLTNLNAAPVILGDHGAPIGAIAVSKDNQWIITNSVDHTVHVWHLTDTGSIIRSFPLEGHESPVRKATFTNDSHWAITGSEDHTVRLWNLTSTNPSKDSIRLSTQTGSLRNLAISSDNRWLVVDSFDGTVRIWDLTQPYSAKLVRELNGITAMSISTDGHWLATANRDSTVRLWNLSNLDLDPVTGSDNTDATFTITMSYDNRWLFTGNQQGIVRRWDLANLAGGPIDLYNQGEPVTFITISPDNHWLATTGTSANLALWDLTVADNKAEPVILRGHDHPVNSVAFSYDSRLLVTGSMDSTIRIWNLTTLNFSAAPIILKAHTDSISMIKISPNSHWLVTGSNDTTARLWDLTQPLQGAKPLILYGHRSAISAAAISPNSHWLVTGSSDTTARLWDLTASNPAANAIVLRGHEQAINAVAISPDNHWLVTGSGDTTARLWDLTANNPAANAIVLRGHEQAINAIAISPDNHWLVTGSSDTTARLWDLTANNPAANAIVLRGHQRIITSLAISANNHWVVTGSYDNTARFWDLARPTLEATHVISFTDYVNTVTFSADNRWAVVGGEDTIAQLWDMTSLDNGPITLGNRNKVRGLAFSPDNRWLVTGGSDGTIRLWNLQLRHLIDLACRTVGHNLPQKDWQQAFPGEAYRKVCPNLPSMP